MPNHVVVDGSNLATEGRSNPSLQQLREAVAAYKEEHPSALITIVVDATFGHRIDPKEVPAFDAAVNTNELVAPPAGAIGRGDAFVLSIANKVKATILTNDSYQEFHGQYDWLFDEGRLVGGKPVPHIGWVFVPRLPVRGPLSRKSTAEAKRKGKPKAGAEDSGTVRVGSADASKPMPVPTSPPPKATPAAHPTPAPAAAATAAATVQAVTAQAAASASARKAGVNDLLQFLTFVEQHPVGTSVNALVDHYSSHGAYVKIGDVMGYVPLRLMADPAPRSAREFMKIGEAVTLVVEKFVPEKRSIDLSIPGIGVAPLPVVAADAKPAKKSRSKKAAAAAAPAPEPESSGMQPEKKSRSKRLAAAKPATMEIAAEPVAAAGPAVAAARPARQGRAKKAAPVPQPAEQPTVMRQKVATPKKASAKRTASSEQDASPMDAPAKGSSPKGSSPKGTSPKGTSRRSRSSKDESRNDTVPKDAAPKDAASTPTTQRSPRRGSSKKADR